MSGWTCRRNGQEVIAEHADRRVYYQMIIQPDGYSRNNLFAQPGCDHVLMAANRIAWTAEAMTAIANSGLLAT